MDSFVCACEFWAIILHRWVLLQTERNLIYIILQVQRKVVGGLARTTNKVDNGLCFVAMQTNVC